MRRIITILITFVYLFTTSGIVINTHYCMGEVAGYAIGQNNEDLCGICGMSNDGCCHDELNILKVEDDHQLAYTGIDLPVIEHHSLKVETYSTNYFPTSKKVYFSHGPMPPLLVDWQAMFCVYRI